MTSAHAAGVPWPGAVSAWWMWRSPAMSPPSLMQAPFGVSSWQDPGLDATGEPSLTKQITHNLRLFRPDVGQLPHPVLSSVLVHQACSPRSGT